LKATGSLLAARERALELMLPAPRQAATVSSSGYLDLLGEQGLGSTGRAQDLMLTRVVPAIYERWWRPALARVAKGATGPGMAEEAKIARLLLGLASGHKVLDVACGPGNFTRAFARTVGPEGLSIGIDASETMLQRGAADTAGAALENVALIRGDATALPFLDGSFDGVCCFAALHLFADPFDALTEMTRVLAPSGRIAVMTSVRRQLTVAPLKPVIERSSGMRLFESEEIVSALQVRGYADIHQRLSGMVQFIGARRAA